MHGYSVIVASPYLIVSSDFNEGVEHVRAQEGVHVPGHKLPHTRSILGPVRVVTNPRIVVLAGSSRQT